jgi:beta-galactosidase
MPFLWRYFPGCAFEPEEGRYDFSWLDRVMDKISENGGYAVLPTRCQTCLAFKHPEVLAQGPERNRNLHRVRPTLPDFTGLPGKNPVN